MSVFSRFREQQSNQQDVVVQPTRPCRGGHRWGGIIPSVDPQKKYVQNASLIGRRCDCGNLLYESESECGCPSDKYWKINFEQ